MWQEANHRAGKVYKNRSGKNWEELGTNIRRDMGNGKC